MKRKFYKLIILLLILSAFSLLMLTSCSDTPDEPVTDNPPSENPPIEDPPSEDPPIDENPPEETPPQDKPTEEEEIIKIGMPIHKVVSRLGTATQLELLSTIYYWDTGDDELLYVWFDNTLRVKKFERRNDLNPDVGMTYSEVCDLLDSRGQKEAYAPNVYSFGLASDNKYLHVVFKETEVDELVVASYAYRPNIAVGMSYEEISTHFNCVPERISFERQIYYCNNDESEACVFEFEETDDALTLSSFEYTEDIFIFSIVDKSYDEICAVLGSTGELCEHEYAKSTIYRWDSDFDADLFVIFNDEMIAERFSYENDLEIKVDVSLDLAKFVLGDLKYFCSYSVNQPPEELAKTNFTVVFETNSEFDMQVCINVGTNKIISIMYGVPRLDLSNDMLPRDVCAVLGEDYYENVFILGEGYYDCWHYGEYDLYVQYTSGTVRSHYISFRKCEGHEENA